MTAGPPVCATVLAEISAEYAGATVGVSMVPCGTGVLRALDVLAAR